MKNFYLIIKKTAKKNSFFFDTKSEEEYLSKHLKEYLNNENIIILRIPVLERILQLYYQNQEKANLISQKDMIDFLFKCLDYHGREASILFNNIDFKGEEIYVIRRLLNQFNTF